MWYGRLLKTNSKFKICTVAMITASERIKQLKLLLLCCYCAVIWDSRNKTNRDYLDKLHRRTASIIEGHKVSQSQVWRIFSWPSLQSCRDYLKCMLVFKCLNNLAPPYLLNEFSHSRDFHSYNTRHRGLLRLPLARTTKYQDCFRFSGTKIWNSLPLDLRRTHDLNKSGLKKHLRSS